jgi:D-glycero-alpha-D-manno-heptose-7-phosphate kinase
MEGRTRWIRSAAPIRICDIGGWTDTWFARHGAILNIAVQPDAEVQVRATEGRADHAGGVILHPEDYGGPYAVPSRPAPCGPHPLLEAAIESMRRPEGVCLEVWVHSDAPPGAGTGTSSAVTVALIAALDALTPGRLGPSDLADAARRVETERLQQQCGVQDQVASAFGGINFIEVTEYPHVAVAPLSLSEEAWWELERRLLLISLGRAHHSSALHEEVIGGLGNAGADAPALKALRACAPRARDALASGDLVAFGRVMAENTEAQARLHPALVGKDAARVIRVARQRGALGWKVNGAGGEGGSITLLCGEDAAQKGALVREILQEDPACRRIPIRLSREGARAWTYPSGPVKIALAAR